MAKEQIVALGVELATNKVTKKHIGSNFSLLDWDIILFKPEFGGFYLNKKTVEHWHREIEQAIEHNKIVFVFLTDKVLPRDDDFGINKIEVSNYDSIPLSLSVVQTHGTKIKVDPRYNSLLGSYWKNFENYSQYKVVINEHEYETCLLTKSGDKPVGLISRSLKSSGALICLPDINFERDEFVVEDKDEWEWNDKAKEFAERFVKEIVALSKTLKKSGNKTTPPEWTTCDNYRLDKEKQLLEKINKIEEKLVELEKQKQQYNSDLENAGSLRELLFETGKPLETVILKALETLGFKVSQFDDGESEFDAIFISEEGRFLGEAEGKDKSAIDVQKLRQLNDNIHDDLEKNEVEEAAKGVLFGNGFRLQLPGERGVQFTQRCIKRAKQTNVSLVATSELFKVVHYLAQNHNDHYAKLCRQAILTGSGIVNFPVASNQN